MISIGRAHPHSLPSPAMAVTSSSTSADRCEGYRSMTPVVVSISIVNSLIVSPNELLCSSSSNRSCSRSGKQRCDPRNRSLWPSLDTVPLPGRAAPVLRRQTVYPDLRKSRLRIPWKQTRHNRHIVQSTFSGSCAENRAARLDPHSSPASQGGERMVYR